MCCKFIASFPDSICALAPNLVTLELISGLIPDFLDTLSCMTNLGKFHYIGMLVASHEPDRSDFHDPSCFDDASYRCILMQDVVGGRRTTASFNVSYRIGSQLPDSIGRLTALTNLHLGNFGLSTLPPSFSRLTKLEKLYLSSNQVSAVFAVLESHLSSLCCVSFSHDARLKTGLQFRDSDCQLTLTHFKTPAAPLVLCVRFLKTS